MLLDPIFALDFDLLHFPRKDVEILPLIIKLLLSCHQSLLKFAFLLRPLLRLALPVLEFALQLKDTINLNVELLRFLFFELIVLLERLLQEQYSLFSAYLGATRRLLREHIAQIREPIQGNL